MAEAFEPQNDGTQAPEVGTESENIADALYSEEAGKDPTREAETQDKAPVAPERYDLKIPDGHIVNEAIMGKFTKLARESGFTAERAQQWADLHLESLGEVIREHHQTFENYRNEVAGWEQEFRRDVELGGSRIAASVADAERLLNAYARPAEVRRLAADLKRTGMGNHPILLKILTRAARAIGNKLPLGNKSRNLEDLMYGGSS